MRGARRREVRVVIAVMAGLLIMSVVSFGMQGVGAGGRSSVPPLITTFPE
jgi:hypothetical protein